MNPVERYWFGPIAAVRPWLLLKATLLLFAFDAWADHLGPAWRYGTADFNVAHFPILDLLPIPSSAAYVGAIVGVGIAAFLAATMPRAPRALLIVVAAVYGWSWSCSMHDSYQHHYLLSWVFLAFCFFPRLSAVDLFGVPASAKRVSGAKERPGAAILEESRKGKKRAGKGKKGSAPSADTKAASSAEAEAPAALVATLSSFGYALVMVTCGVVYSYTAVSKTEPDWLSGAALQNITADGRNIPGFIDLAEAIGLEGESLWWWLGHSVVLLQIGIALGYFTAPLRDQISERGARIALDVIAWIAWALAIQFHLGAEYMGLEIGWFSYYMIILATVALLPARALSVSARVLSTPLRELAAPRGPAGEPSVVMVGSFVAGALLALALAGLYADLPGALIACLLAGLGLVLWAVLGHGMRRSLRDVRAASAMAVLAALGIYVAMSNSEERYDYWRFAGGDFRRRGDTAAALNAYEHALRYASDEPRTDPAGRELPPERERVQARVEELRDQLERERSH